MKPRWALSPPRLWPLLGPAGAGFLCRDRRAPSFRGHLRIAWVYILRRAIFDTSVPRKTSVCTGSSTIRIFPPDKHHSQSIAFQNRATLTTRISREETERALRRILRLRDVHVCLMPVGNRRVDVVVETQDTWTTEPYASVSSTGGETNPVRGRERNLFGLGKQINVSYKRRRQHQPRAFLRRPVFVRHAPALGQGLRGH
ncbi:MAG: hypothetical protein IPI26_05765 [Elusimicrobia bacterium]|nr:hypothetical protein [Elusimicrobiota bacterium]